MAHFDNDAQKYAQCRHYFSPCVKSATRQSAVVLADVAGDVGSFYVGWGEERPPTFTGFGLFLLGFTSSPQSTALRNATYELD